MLLSFMLSNNHAGAVTENVYLCDAVAQTNGRLSRAHCFRGIVERNLLVHPDFTDAEKLKAQGTLKVA